MSKSDQDLNPGQISRLIPEAALQGLSDAFHHEDIPLPFWLLTIFQSLLYRHLDYKSRTIFASIHHESNHHRFTTRLTTDMTFRGQLRNNYLQIDKDSLDRSTINHQQHIPPEELFNSNAQLDTIFFSFSDIAEPEKTENLQSLHIKCSQASSGVQITIFFNPQQYTETEILPLLDLANQILESVINDPDQLISKIPLLSENELNKILFDWNDTFVEYNSGTCLHTQFESQVIISPNAVAAIFDGNHYTLKELSKYSNQFAHYLRSLGIGPETRIGICLDHSFDMLVSLFGILKAGCTYVPIDPDYPPERIQFIIKDADLANIITTPDTQTSPFAASPVELIFIENINGSYPLFSDQPVTNPVNTITSKSIATILYTSGSTGNPKGVMLTHRNIIARFEADSHSEPLQPGEVFAQTSSLSFVDHLQELFWPPICGFPTLIIPAEILNDPQLLLNHLEEFKATRIILVPSFLRVLLNTIGDQKGRLPTLWNWIVGGEPLPPNLIPDFFDKLPHTQMVNGYGATETAGDGTFFNTQQPFQSANVPIGRPLENVQLYILDEEMQPVPIGFPGELYVGGTSISKGYLNRPELTAHKFIHNPFTDQPDGRLWKSGDIGRYLRDGVIEFIGRIDNQIKIRGIRIETSGIEIVINQHPDIKESLVIGKKPDAVEVAHQHYSDLRLLAYVVPHSGNQISHTELRSSLQQKLPDHCIPSAFISLDTFPLNPNGKIERNALPEPDFSQRGIQIGFFAPKSELEKQLAAIWEDIFHINPISVHDNFYDLGGDSFMAMELFAKIEHNLGKRLPISLLIQSQTISQLALSLDIGDQAASWTSLVPIQPEGEGPPIFLVHADGGIMFYQAFVKYFPPSQRIYGLQATGLDGTTQPLDSIEKMAAHYLKEIKSVQPQGPYNLGSYSLGTLIILEMGQQLIRSGDEVGLLANIDADAPGYPNLPAAHNTMKYKFTAHLFTLRDYDLPHKLRYIRNRVWHRIRENLTSIFSWLYVKVNFPMPYPIRYYFVRKIIYQAIDQYKLGKYPGKMTLFRATKQPLVPDPDPTLGWEKLVSGELEICDVEGTHNSMVHEPYLGELVKKINERLVFS